MPRRPAVVVCLSVMCVCLVASAGAALPRQSQKPTSPTPDEKAIHEYVLTVDKAEKFSTLLKKFQAAANDPTIAAEMQKIQDVNAYNVEKAQMMAKSPKLMALFSGSGLTPRDYVVLPLTLMSAAVIAQYPQSAAKMPYVTPQQVQFYKDHKVDLEKWGLK